MGTDETEDLLHGARVGGYLQVRNQSADGSVAAIGGGGDRVDLGPVLAEGGHRVHQAVGILLVGFEENGHPVLSEEVVDVGIALAFLALRQEGRNILLVVDPKGGEGAEAQDEDQEEDRAALMRRQPVVDMQDDSFHRPRSIRG